MKVYHDKRTVYTSLSKPQYKPAEEASYRDALSLMADVKDSVRLMFENDDGDLDVMKRPGEFGMNQGEILMTADGLFPSEDSKRPGCQEAHLSDRQDGKNWVKMSYQRSGDKDIYVARTETPESGLVERLVYNSSNDTIAFVAEETFYHPKG